jgi:isoquinoline 1-oxidoreductase beta subunit
MVASEISRRDFVVTASALAGGFALGVTTNATQAAAMRPSPGAQYWASDAADPREVTAWVAIAPDDTVTFRFAIAEVGQGSSTGWSQLLAEELECDWSKVRFECASANRNLKDKPYGIIVGGADNGIRIYWALVQQAGASARARLIAAAAKRWNVAEADCIAAKSKVTHKPSGRTFRFGELAPEAAGIVLAKEPDIKPPEQYKLVGTPLPRLDTPLKVNGTAIFGPDIRLPGMLYASLMTCPVFGGKLVSADETSIQGRRGIVQVVKLDDAVAVVADNFWRANEALKALKIVWDFGANGHANSAQYRKEYLAALDTPQTIACDIGDAKGELAKSSNVITALFEVPHLSHSPLEPPNATVHWQQDRLDIWMGTQVADRFLQMGATAFALKPEQVFFHNCYVGGGFGRRGPPGDDLRYALLIAKAVGHKPVQTQWSREEDTRNDHYRPQAALRLKGTLGPDGTLSVLHAETAVASLIASITGKPVEGVEVHAVDALVPERPDVNFVSSPYTRIPNRYTGQVLKNTHVPVGFWRSVGGSQNGFALESFLDEMAHEANKNPFEFRRAMTDRADVLAVLKLLEEKSDWGKPLPKGRGRGLALMENHASLIGEVFEVSVSDAGALKVDRAVAVIDTHHIVNPKLVEAQVQGGIVFGLSAALYGEITIKDGAVEQGNFDTYQMVRLADAPDVEVHFSLSGGLGRDGKPRWGGAGECAVSPAAPGVANAIFAATGKRIRTLPLKNTKLV